MNNNKGFTLIELLGILVILTIILLVAIPNITSTFERNKQKINKQKEDIILSAAEIYANKYKEMFDYTGFLSGTCGFSVSAVKERNLLTEEELLDSEGNNLKKYDTDIKDVMIKYNNGKFELVSSINSCYYKGDVNRDGEITQEDVLLIYDYLSDEENYALDKEQMYLADFTKDGNVLSNDAIEISTYIK